MLNFMWKFSLRVYAQTNKNIYKKGCCQTSKVIMDSEPRVAALLETHRTCNDSGRPCAAIGLDHKNEKVSCCMPWDSSIYKEVFGGEGHLSPRPFNCAGPMAARPKRFLKLFLGIRCS
jgi:hypothetical protein